MTRVVAYTRTCRETCGWDRDQAAAWSTTTPVAIFRLPASASHGLGDAGRFLRVADEEYGIVDIRRQALDLCGTFQRSAVDDDDVEFLRMSDPSRWPFNNSSKDCAVALTVLAFVCTKEFGKFTIP